MDKKSEKTKGVKVDQDVDTHTVDIDDCSTAIEVVDKEESFEGYKEELMRPKQITKCSNSRLKSVMKNVKSEVVVARGRLAGFGRWVLLQILNDWREHDESSKRSYKYRLFRNHTWYRAELESMYFPHLGDLFFSNRYYKEFDKDIRMLIDKAYNSYEEVRKCKLYSDAEKEALKNLFKMMANDYAWLNEKYPWVRTDPKKMRNIKRNINSYVRDFKNDLHGYWWGLEDEIMKELKMKNSS